MDSDCISEDEFWDEWKVVKRSNGELFDFDDVKDRPINLVWTILESGDDVDERLYASPGLHFVNRVGYVMTKRAWVKDQYDAIYAPAHSVECAN